MRIPKQHLESYLGCGHAFTVDDLCQVLRGVHLPAALLQVLGSAMASLTQLLRNLRQTITLQAPFVGVMTVP